MEKIQEEKEAEEPQNCHDETKNIPKNYIKAIFSFILENGEYIERIFAHADLHTGNCSMARFIEYIKTEKKTKRYTI
jgi:predicted unusual protein kinase regulating ubiquinone biosynthesis (AarF/ABC1/UbiB family)